MTHAVIWLIIGIACGIVEVFTVGFWFLWLAAAALLVSLGTELQILKSPISQIMTFVILTLLFVIFTRPLVVKMIKTRDVKSNVDSLIGQIVVVTRDIAPLEMGEAKIYGEVWTARSDHFIPAGSRARVTAVEGVKLVVEPLRENE